MTVSFVGDLSGGVEELVEVEALGLHDRVSAGVEPLGARAVVVELDAVAVRIGQVDRDGAAVVGGVVDRELVVEQAAHGAAELAAVGVEERDVVETGVPLRRWRTARAVQAVQADVVVVVAGREQHHVEADLARIRRHGQAERVAVERKRAIEVGDAQVHVSDAHRGVDGFLVHVEQCPVRDPLRHRCVRLSEPPLLRQCRS
jgi:hypothetical protein